MCGTATAPPVNPMFQYAAATLGLHLEPKHRDGPQVVWCTFTLGRPQVDPRLTLG